MATVKTITRFSQAPAAPTTIPDNALVLVEIGNQVYKMTWAALVAAIVAEVPTGD